MKKSQLLRKSNLKYWQNLFYKYFCKEKNKLLYY